MGYWRNNYGSSGFGFGNKRKTVRCYDCGGPHLRPDCPRRRRSTGNGGARSAKKAKTKCPWEEMKKPKLEAACKERGLSHRGKKKELVERLKQYVVSGASRQAAASAAAAAPSGAGGALQDLFEIDDDDDNDAAMMEAAANVESALLDRKPSAAAATGGISRGRREMTITAIKPSADAKLGLTLQPAANGAGVLVKAIKPDSIFTGTRLEAGMVIRKVGGVKFQSLEEAVGLFKRAGMQISVSVDVPEPTEDATTAPSMSQESQTSVTSAMASLPLSQSSASSATKRELTEDQKERMKRMRKEAMKKRMARSSNGSVASASMSQSPQSSQGSQRPGPLCSPANPYAKVKEEEAPDDLPPVREETRNTLSEEQMAVIMAARPPTVIEEAPRSEENTFAWMSRAQKPHMVRVNAAAGTGKTTTLLHLATRCIDLGHESVNYVTYSKASATDAKERMQALLDDGHKACVHGSTLHSCAMTLLQNQPLESEDMQQDTRIYDDNAFQTHVIRQHWGKALEEAWAQPALDQMEAAATTDNAKRTLANREKLLFDKAAFYLWKAFGHFCKSKLSVEELTDTKNEKRHYYPVKRDFAEDGPAAKLGFPPAIYHSSSKWSFFADKVAEIWDHVIRDGIRTFDAEIKRAQLNKLRIPCSVLLVDESQDLDQCQVDWLASQTKFGTHIYFVGDAAQSIYGFRGAKSTYVMRLDCKDLLLTKSWRFGPSIAKAANIALFAKEHSPQTTAKERTYSPLWKPYRVQGAKGEEESKVVSKSLVANWRDYKPLTLIGATNAGLMAQAMDLLGLSGLKNPDTPVEGSPEEGGGESTKVKVDVGNIPRFHINGKGDNSGFGKWRRCTTEIRHLYALWSNRDEESGPLPMELPEKEFPDFAQDGPMTWNDFAAICQAREIARYAASASVVTTYGQNTLEALDHFESHVLGDKKCSEDEADIILTTCHSAKGLEWDHVEICSDLHNLHAASFKSSLGSTFRHPSFLRALPGDSSSSLDASTKATKRAGWEFALSSYSDKEINLLYVAMTRARKTLCVQEGTKSLLQELDLIHFLARSFVEDACNDQKKTPARDEETMIIAKDKKLNKSDVWDLYHDLCVPLRKELGLSDTQMLLSSLLPDCEVESASIKEEVTSMVKKESEGSTEQQPDAAHSERVAKEEEGPRADEKEAEPIVSAQFDC